MANQKRSLSIVVVDDNASMRSALRAILKSDGHTVVGEAGEGRAALNLIRQHKPDVVLLDMVMSGMQGLEVLEEINKLEQGTEVLVVSGSDDQALIHQAFQLGAAGSVAKPLNPERILRTLDQLARVATATHDPGREAAPASARRCAIIDGDPETRSFLRVLLEREQLEVIEAVDGMQGLVAVEEHHPDLVFLDVDMPELDGLNVLRCLRAVHPDLQVIMATSRAEGDIVKQAVAYRVAGYLLKPFDSAKVLDVVRKVFGNAGKTA